LCWGYLGWISTSSYANEVVRRARNTIALVSVTGRRETSRMTVNCRTRLRQSSRRPGIGYDACIRDGHSSQAAPYQQIGEWWLVSEITSSSETTSFGDRSPSPNPA
jgi:hypothetical protein